jgi:uncharacterized protein with PQ loop repeat
LYYLLFVIYFLACCYFITKIKFVKHTGLGTKVVLLLFVTKVAAGIIGGLVSHFLMHDNTDQYGYTLQSLVEYNNLIHHPKIFFTDSLPSAYANNLGEFFGSHHSFWNDLRNNILIKTIGILNILSRGNYYINSLFFNFVSFLGHVALFRVFKHIFAKQHWAIIVGCFLLPSTLYFTSLIGKDMLVFTALSIFCYALYFSLQDRFTKKRIVYLLLSFITILLIRNFIAAILLPCGLAWYVSNKLQLNPLKVFGTSFLCAFLAIFLAQFLPEKYDPLNIVVEKQQAFFSLGTAASQYQNDTLQPTIKSFATAAPGALRHSFLSPYPAEFDNVYLNIVAAEIIVYLLLALMMFIFPRKNNAGLNAFIIFGLVFTCLIFLFSGYITTNAGALIRYRSIYYPFIIVVILCSIDLSKVKRLFFLD